MKIKTILTIGAVATLTAGTSWADQTINITGSTAFRAAVVRALQDTMTGETAAYTGTGLSAGSEQLFVGTYPGLSGVTYVRTAWNGSVEGVKAVANPVADPTNYIPITAPTSGAGTLYAGALEVGIPKIAFSDVYQISTPVTTPTFSDELVGVVTFVWVANEGAPVTNMSTQLANSLLAAGTLNLGQFTGNTADATKTVYATGRYNGSGTRATALAEIGYGVFNPVVQYYATTGGINTTITALQLWPNTSFATPTGGTNDALNGNGGYTSGGTLGLREVIGCSMDATVTIKNPNGSTLSTTSGSNVALVGYLGTGDAANSAAAGRVQMTYNGVAYSVPNVKNGYYTLWGYQHLMYGTLTADETTFKTTLASAIPTALDNLGSGAPGIKYTDMAVSRGSDGGLVSP